MDHFQPNPEEHAKDIRGLRLAVISAGLSHLGEQEAAHSKLVRRQVAGAKDGLVELGVKEDNILYVECPGVLEIPQMSRTVIKTQGVDGVIACALVVNGGIYRHEFVAQTSLDQLIRASVETDTPIASCMLTPQQEKSPETQFEFLNDHLYGKGQESAGAVVRQILQRKAITASRAFLRKK